VIPGHVIPGHVIPPALLRDLLRDSLALWGVAGEAGWDGDALRVAAAGRSFLVRAAGEADRPARWLLADAAAPDRPPRPALSVTGLLGALRGRLVAPAPVRRLRIAPRAEAPAVPPGAAAAADPGLTPVLLVTGFLGSGKTTLVARMLRDPALSRTAVIVNEFGAVGIDHDLLAAGSDGPVRLATGCLCCAVRGSLAATLLDLDRRRRDGEAPFERVVIETSGLADPAPILHELMTDADVAARFRPDGVVTLVDAVHGEASLAAHPEARQQAALADRLIITKTDLAAPSPALRGALAALNPDAPVMEAARGDVPPDRLFGGGRPRPLPARAAAAHTDGIGHVVLSPADPVPGAALALFLRALAELAAGRLLRAKGFVRVAERPDRPALIQGVGHVFEPPEWPDAPPGGEAETRLVLIAAGMPPRWPGRLLAAISAEVREETLRRAAAA